MKRTLANLLPLSLLVSATAFASGAPEPEVVPVAEKDRFVIGLEAHFFRSSQTDLDYIVTISGDNPEFRINYLNPDYEFSGGRIFASYMFTNENDLQLSWMHASQSDSDRVNQPDVGLLSPVFNFLGDALASGESLDEIDSISLKKEVDIDVIDLDMGHIFHDENYMVRIFAGLRYATIDDTLSFRVAGTADVGDADLPVTFTVKHHSKMHGIGPRGGFDARYRLMDHVSVTGHAAVSLLASHIDARTHYVTDPAAPNADSTIFKTDEIERLVPNIDARLGLAVDFMFDEGWGLVIEGGMHADHFFNGSTTASSLLIVGHPVTRDVSEYGPYLGVSILFS